MKRLLVILSLLLPVAAFGYRDYRGVNLDSLERIVAKWPWSRVEKASREFIRRKIKKQDISKKLAKDRIKRIAKKTAKKTASDAAKETFLKMIEDKYCEDMGIEGYYAFHHAMDKDD